MFALVYTLNIAKLQISLRIRFGGGGKKMLILLYFMKFSSKRTFPQAF